MILAQFPVPAMMKDPRDPFVVTADSIARAKQAQAEERQRVFDATGLAVSDEGKILTYGEQWERATAIGELALIVNRFGAKRVQKWLQSLTRLSPVDHVDELAQGEERQ